MRARFLSVALVVFGTMAFLHVPFPSSIIPQASMAEAAESKASPASRYLRRAEKEFKEWHMDEAIDLATRALKLSPEMQEALALRGAAYCERGWAYGEKADLVHAIADLDRAIALNAKDARSLRYRGIAFRQLDNTTPAVADLKLSLELEPNAETAGALADTYGGMEHPDLAIQTYELAMRLDPASPVYPLSRGQLHAEAGDYERAIEDFTLALKIDPRYGIAYQYRSLVQYVLGNPSQALKDINRALKLSPGDVGSLYYRGMIELGLGDITRADESFRSAMKGCGDCITYRVLAEITGQRLGKPDNMARHFPDGQQLEWPAPLVRYFQKRSSFDDVLEAAKTPGRFNGPASQTCDAYFLTGEWKLAENDTAGAESYFAKALELCSKSLISWPVARDELARLK